MTTETPTRETLDAGVLAAQTDFDAAQAKASEASAELLKAVPLDFIALGKVAGPVEDAKRRLDKAVQALADFVASSKWEGSAELRAPAENIIRSLFITDKPVTGVMSARGKIVIAEDGSVTSTLIPQMRPFDTEILNAMIVAEVNGPALFAQGITSINVDVRDADKPDAMVKLMPTSASGKQASTGGTGEARAGALEYEYNGAWLSSKQLLDALMADNHAFYQKRSKSAAWTGGNGMSNMAKDAAKDLSLPSRGKPAVA